MTRKRILTALAAALLVASSASAGYYSAPTPETAHTHKTLHYECRECANILSGYISAVVSKTKGQ